MSFAQLKERKDQIQNLIKENGIYVDIKGRFLTGAVILLTLYNNSRA